MNRMKILVVDDEPHVRLILEELIRSEEVYDVDGADNAFEAIEKLEKEDFDIVITDYMMPKMSGFELTSKIKTDPRLKDIMVLILTAYSEMDTKMVGYELGADDYISKPYEPMELLAKIKAFVRLKELQNQLKEGKHRLEVLNRQLEESFEGTVKLLLYFMDLRLSGASDRALYTKDICEFLAYRLGLNDSEVFNAGYAGMFCELGKVVLPDKIISKPIKELNKQEIMVYRQHPSLAQIALEGIDKLRDAGGIIKHMYENFDGTGVPDRLSKDNIPVLSRVLRISADYSFYYSRLSSSDKYKAILLIEKKARLYYDPSLIEHLKIFIDSKKSQKWDSSKKVLGVSELKDGMTLGMDLYTSSGVKLLSKNAIITKSLLAKILRYHMADPIKGSITVVDDTTVLEED